MTNCFDRYTKTGYCHTHRHLLITLVLSCSLKVAKFRYIKRKASINAIQYVLLPPPKGIRDTLGVSLRCKVSIFFSYDQIFLQKNAVWG